MGKTVVYPGTFDPVTNGHLDVIKRASKMFDKVIVAISISKDKNPMFDHEQRVEMIKHATKDLQNIEVKAFDTLLVDFVKNENSNIVVRGLRAVSDFEYELQMGYANGTLYSELETVYLMPCLQSSFISSSIVRSVIKHKGDISHLVPEGIMDCI